MLCSALLTIMLVAPLFGATPAMFRGRVVEVADQPKRPGMIYVLGRNGSLRKVLVTNAQVEYSEDIPRRFRKPQASKSLVQGADVRIEAQEASAGLWRATSIEILQVPGSPKPKEYTPPPASPHRKTGPEPSLSRRSS